MDRCERMYFRLTWINSTGYVSTEYGIKPQLYRGYTKYISQLYVEGVCDDTIGAVNTERFKSRVSALVNIFNNSTFVPEVDWLLINLFQCSKKTVNVQYPIENQEIRYQSTSFSNNPISFIKSIIQIQCPWQTNIREEPPVYPLINQY